MDITKTTITVNSKGEEEQHDEKVRVFVAKVPIMLKSAHCTLYKLSDKDLMDLGECPYDQGGYFIVTGGEKVLVAQEKMSNNRVYVFKKSQPSKYSYVAEIRSCLEIGSRPTSTMYVKINRQSQKFNCISATLPYIRKDIPVIIVFRALGLVEDKDILEHICYDFGDTKMMDLLRPSLEESFVIQDQNVFIKI